MGSILDAANTAFRDYVTDGVPGSGANKPDKEEIRAVFQQVEETLSDLYAPLNSPALTGTPTAPTAASGTNTTQIATTAGARIYARDVNPEYMFSKVFEGHEADADHTSLFNAAFAEVSAARGGTIRFDAKEYRLASTPNAINTSGVYLKGVASSGVAGAGGASQTGTVFRLTGTGIQNGITWGDDLGVSGYQWEGGGIEDIRFEAQGRTNGYALAINRGRNFRINRIHMWEVYNGINIYGTMNTTLHNSTIEQVKGTRCIRFTGDTINRSDILDIVSVFVGAQHAGTGSRAVGLAWEQYAHTLAAHSLRIVNPSIGVLIDGQGASSNGYTPHYGFFHDLEVDFSQDDAVTLANFKHMNFINCYFHGNANGSSIGIRAIGTSEYGVLNISKSLFSNYPSHIFIGCRDVGVSENVFTRTSASSAQYISSNSDAQRVRIVGNQFGTTIFGAGQSGCIGVALASGSDRWIVTGNQFNDVATAVQNFGSGALVNTNNQT